MTVPWEVVGLWPVRALVAGGAVLLFGRLLVTLTRQPARRVWVGTAAVVVALLAIPLSAIPGWLPIPVPSEAVTVAKAQAVEPDRGMTAAAPGIAAAPFGAPVGVPPPGGFEPGPPKGGTPARHPRPRAAAA